MANLLSGLTDEYIEKLYQRLSILIKGAGISNKKLGEILNVSEDVIEAWLNKKRYPKVQYLGELANLFNVSVEYLLCRTDNAKRITDDEIKDRYYGRELIAYKRNNSIDLSSFSKEQAEDIVNYCKIKKNEDFRKSGILK